ncbi:ATP-binding protein [Pacificimonas flava]|uniref:ATP-binding protein n=2 Tax=Pacificimonas TaxID=1960290 RepID=A0A219B3F5_9SPHN|nr:MULTISPECIES: ATP-binding protein [Pacificimonas]MBZ6378006.1 ATP-binding protein [Pacificimonas aurantium]OWV32349.1 ATP-binding protein [Pacificimonas flava]
MKFDKAKRAASLDLATDRDVARARTVVGRIMKEQDAKVLMQTRFVTAVSEIARNAVRHGGGGTMEVYLLPGGRIGVECRDEGPGIADVEAALTDGFSTINSMGRGLGGAKRLSELFIIETMPNEGTTIRMTSRLRGGR